MNKWISDILGLIKVKTAGYLTQYMMVVGFVLIILTLILCTTGCGHNRVVETKSWGLGFNLPFGDLGSVSVCIGSTETVSALVRGGASFTTETATGAGIFAGAGGEGRISSFKSNAQLNEGNLVAIMTSTNVPDEAKIELAKNLKNAAASPSFTPSAMKVREAEVYSNGFTNQLNNTFQTTGIDRLGDNVTEVATTVVDDVATGAGHTAKAIVDITKDTVEKVDSTVKKVADNMSIGNKIRDTIIDGTANISKSISMILLITVILCIFCIILCTRKRKVRKVPKTPSVTAPPPPNMVDEVPAGTAVEECEVPQVDDTEDPFPEEPKKSWIIRFFEAIFDIIKSCLFFWRSLPEEDQDLLKRNGKKVCAHLRDSRNNK